MSTTTGPEPVPDAVYRQLVAQGITIDASAAVVFGEFLDAAQSQVDQLVQSAGLTAQITGQVSEQVDKLVAEIATASVNGTLDSATFLTMRIKLCPGFFPFC